MLVAVVLGHTADAAAQTTEAPYVKPPPYNEFIAFPISVDIEPTNLLCPTGDGDDPEADGARGCMPHHRSLGEPARVTAARATSASASTDDVASDEELLAAVLAVRDAAAGDASAAAATTADAAMSDTGAATSLAVTGVATDGSLRVALVAFGLGTALLGAERRSRRNS